MLTVVAGAMKAKQLTIQVCILRIAKSGAGAYLAGVAATVIWCILTCSFCAERFTTRLCKGMFLYMR